MASVIASGMGPILLACRNHLIAQIPFLTADPPHCIVAAKREVPAFKEDHDVVIKPGSFINMRQEFDSAGRVATKFRRFLLMYPRCRVALDEADSDQVFLTDPTLGFLPWEETCANVLSGFFPIDTSMNHLTTEEIRLSDGSDPNRGAMGEWGDSLVTLEIEYMFSLQSVFWKAPLITSAAPPGGTHAVAYAFTFTAASPEPNTTPYTWTTIGTLPTGLTIASGTGVLSGTPTTPGSYSFTAICTDVNAQRAVTACTIVIA